LFCGIVGGWQEFQAEAEKKVTEAPNIKTRKTSESQNSTLPLCHTLAQGIFGAFADFMKGLIPETVKNKELVDCGEPRPA